MPSSKPIRISPHSHETQLSAIRLSRAAEAGDVARDLGYLPTRQLTPPLRRVAEPSSILYVWPSPSDHHPLPRRA